MIKKFRFAITSEEGNFKDIDDAPHRIKFVYLMLEELINSSSILEHKLIKIVSIDQFTGRKIDDFEVYERDIIRHKPDGYAPHDPLEVFWDDQLDGFSTRSLDEAHLYQTPIPVTNYKIIGNIHHNPEIVKAFQKTMEL